MAASSTTTHEAFPGLSPLRRRISYALIVLLGFSLGVSEFVVIGIEPELAEHYHSSLAQIGDLISLFALSYAIATPSLAIATARFRRSRLLAIYLLVFVAANFAAMVAPSLGVLMASRVVMGAVAGPLLAVGTTYVSDLLGPWKSSMGISVVYAAFSIALVLATSAGRMVVAYWSWHVALVVAFAFAVVTAVLLVTVLPKEGGRKREASLTSPRHQIGLLKERAVVFGVLVFMFGVGGVYAFYGYVTPYLETDLGLSNGQSGAVLLAFGCICFFSDLLSGWLDGKFGMKSLPPVFVVLTAALLGLWLSGTHVAPALVAMGFIALLMYAFSIQAISMFMEIARRHHPGALVLAASIEPTSFNIGIAFGTTVGGAAVTNLGLGSVGLVGAALSAVALVCAVLALRAWKKMRPF